ncbi:hypothetical protein V5E97_12310 [Singulisphaera sp. Ch08]|uniref:Uncharacterized protein n=1 Tax=Singulisphaera sp. Ch08 TaxID=3120278 RepID=A0AAU7CNH1_9BACT
MAYSADVAKLLTDQLSRFITVNRHQLAGQMANLKFWMGEVRHCLGVIDGYPQRFERLKRAQTTYVANHGTVEYLLDDPRETTTTATPPRRVPHRELVEARRLLCDSAYRFLVRGFNENHFDEATLRETCRSLGLGIEAGDLRPRSNPHRGRKPGDST